MASDDLIVEKIKSSHKTFCEPLNDIDILSMDFNANMKKRIVEEDSTIQKIFQDEQSKMIKNYKT